MNSKLGRARRRGRRSSQAQRPWRRDREGGPGHPDQAQRRAAAGRRKAQADITMVSMTLAATPTRSMMTLLKLVSTQVPVSQGFADLVGFVNLGVEPARPRGGRAECRKCRRAGEEFQGDVGQGRGEARYRRYPAADRRACRKAGEAWLKLGSGDDASSRRAARKSPPANSAQKLLDETRGLTDELAKEVAGQVKAVTNKTKEATDRSDEAIGFGTFVMLMIAAVSVAGAALVRLVLYRPQSGGAAGRPGEHHDAARRAAISPPKSTPGAAATRSARWRKRCRCSARASCRPMPPPPKRHAEQEAKQRQAALIDQLTREFNDGATSALAAVSTAASRMKGSAEKMSQVAAQAKEQTGAVASASEQAAANVQTVAAATEELSGSIIGDFPAGRRIRPYRRPGGGAGGEERSHGHRACQRGQSHRRSGRPDQHASRRRPTFWR